MAAQEPLHLRARSGPRFGAFAGTGDTASLGRWVTRGGLASLAAVPIILAASSTHFHGVTVQLPVAALDLGDSFLRMLVAYSWSLAFALTYGYFAAVYRSGEKLLLPVLDILQSVPILGFFPFVILIFVGLTPGSWVGPNLASIFLIFTSMSWNMAFGVYESLKSVPGDLKEAADSFGVHGSQRLRQMLLPSTINRLVYNSVLSWTAGWYFLVAAEIISTSASTNPLPGIGSYLLTAAAAGNTDALIAGIVLLVALIAALDLLVWRPLSRWAEKYRYDQSPSGEGEVTGVRDTHTRLRRAAVVVVRGVRSGVSMVRMPIQTFALRAVAPIRARPRPHARLVGYYAAVGGGLIVVWLLLIVIVLGAYHTFTGRIYPHVADQIRTLPIALGASASRLVIAYLLALSISLPLAAFLARRPRVARFGLPAVEIFASVPATALFPLFIFGLVPYLHTEGTAILMLVTGMIWYLFFNILSGLRSIPPDLQEAAKSFGLPRREYYRRLVIPALIPALVTGSITAFGGGWNTLIIAEYLQYGSRTLQVTGIGALIDNGNYETCGVPPVPCGYPLMAAALVTLVFTVIVVNELLWKPVYRRAVEKYRYD